MNIPNKNNITSKFIAFNASGGEICPVIKTPRAPSNIQVPERELVYRSGRRQGEDRAMEARLQPGAATLRAGLQNARGVRGPSGELQPGGSGARGLKRQPLAPHPHPRCRDRPVGRTKTGESHTICGLKMGGRSQGFGAIHSGALWKEYQRRCRRAHMDAAAFRTFNLYVKRLEEVGLITSRRALGVRGNVRIFSVRAE